MQSVARKLFSLIQGRDRLWLYGVALVIILRSGIEVVGVASIMPFLEIVSNPEQIHQNAYLSWAYETFGFGSDRGFLLAAGFGVLTLLVINNATAAFAVWIRLKFIARLRFAFANQLFGEYLGKPYSYFLDRNTSALNKNIVSEVNEAVGVVGSLLNIATHAFLSLALLTLLFTIDWFLALCILAGLGTAYGVIWAFVKHKLEIIGRERFEANKDRYQVIGEAFGGIKIVKVLGREHFFHKAFEPAEAKYERNQVAHEVIGQLPRFGLEAVAFGGILAIILYYLALGLDVQAIVPMVGLYTFAGYRMMPSLQSIFKGISKIRYKIPALDEVYRDLVASASQAPTSDPEPVRPLPFKSVFELRDVSFTYPGAENPALKHVSLEVPKGHSIGLVGPTGSGKTTTIDIILGLFEPQKGELIVDGRPVTDRNRRRWQAQLGYVPQEIYLADDSIKGNIAFGLPEEDIEEDAVIRAAGMANILSFIEKELPDGLETQVGERGVRLSGGQRQRIGIARALYHDPEIFIFDEATSDLDNVTEQAIVDAIAEIDASKTIVQIAHRLSTVKDCDRIYVLEGGKVIDSGSYECLLDSSETFRQMAHPHAQ